MLAFQHVNGRTHVVSEESRTTTPPAAGSGPAARRRRLAIHLGGALGPFGSYMVIPVLPEIADHYETSLSTAAWSVSTYTFALAGAMLLTGRAAQRFGLERTIRFGYVSFAVASLLCIVAPSVSWFLGGRALQGVANAFTTPLLVVVLQRSVEPRQLGRELGFFGSAQAAGMAVAPMLVGVLALWDYRFAFAVTLLASVLLAVTSEKAPPGRARPLPPAHGAPRRSLLNLPLARACAVALTFNLAASGILVLSAALGEHQLDMASSTRGAIIGAYGLAGLLAAPVVGRTIDSFGVRAAGSVSFAVLATTVALMGWATTAVALMVGVAIAGAASTSSRVTVNSLALASTPDNTAGATSAAMAAMFLGAALAPLVLLPVYAAGPHLAFLVSASGAALAALLLAPRLSRPSG